MNLYAAIVAIVALWAIVRVSQHWLEHRRAERGDGGREQHNVQVEQLEERVRTLERIVTDDGERLRHKFDELE